MVVWVTRVVAGIHVGFHGHDSSGATQVIVVLVTRDIFVMPRIAAVLGLYRFPCPRPGPGVRMKVVSRVKVSSELNSSLELSLAASACRYVSKRSLPSSNSRTVKVVD